MVEVDNIGAERGDAGQQMGDVSANMQPHAAAQPMESSHQLLFKRQDERFIGFPGDLAGDGIADANGVGASRNLGAGKIDGGLDTAGHQRARIRGVVEQIHEKIRDAPQVGGLGGGTLDPAQDRVVIAGARAEGAHRLNPVEHARGLQGIGPRELREIRVFRQRRFQADRHAVARKRHGRAEAGGFPIGIGDRAELIEAEFLGATQVGLDQDAGIRGEGVVVGADVLGGELHQDRQARQNVGAAAAEDGEVTFTWSHG